MEGWKDGGNTTERFMVLVSYFGGEKREDSGRVWVG